MTSLFILKKLLLILYKKQTKDKQTNKNVPYSETKTKN